MPDNQATLAPEDQAYFDSRGGEDAAPAVAEKPPVEKPAAAPRKPAKAAKTTEEITEEAAPEAAPEPVKKTAEQQQIENLNKALREERDGRKEFESKATLRLQQLQETMMAAQQPKQATPQAPEIPDPEKDAMGALRYLMGQQQNSAISQAQTEQERARHAERQTVMGEAARLELEYLREQPDFDAATGQSKTYGEAITFLVSGRRAELNALGTYNPMQVNQIVAQETLDLAQQALRNGKNPARLAMEVAKARGFSPKPKEQAQQPAETEQERLARIAKGQEAGFSLSQASGSKAPANKQLDAKTLANMTDEAFADFMEKAKKSNLRELMGD